MSVEHDVHILEHTVPNVKRFCPELLLGHPWPQHQRAREVLPLHDFFHRECRRDNECLPRVVSLAVSGCPHDERIAIRHPWFLRCLRNTVDIGPQRDDRLARTPGCHPRTGYAGDTVLYLEPVLLENIGDVSLGLELLEPELGEAEHAVDHLLGEVAAALNIGGDLVPSTRRVARRLLARRLLARQDLAYPGAPWLRERHRCWKRSPPRN